MLLSLTAASKAAGASGAAFDDELVDVKIVTLANAAKSQVAFIWQSPLFTLTTVAQCLSRIERTAFSSVGPIDVRLAALSWRSNAMSARSFDCSLQGPRRIQPFDQRQEPFDFLHTKRCGAGIFSFSSVVQIIGGFVELLENRC